ncbi:MAG: hypothetical protein WCD73_16695, partial [Pseudolabrys sp.]
VRTRSTFGLNVTVSVIVESRDALFTDSGTVDGPLATRISGGAVTMAAETARKERRLSPDMVSNRLLEADRMPEPASSSKFYG